MAVIIDRVDGQIETPEQQAPAAQTQTATREPEQDSHALQEHLRKMEQRAERLRAD